MPPLAAMLAIREGHGSRWKDDHGLRKEMTAIDWKALDAFERVLNATAAVKTSLWFGAFVACLTVLLWSLDTSSPALLVLYMRLGTLVSFNAGLAIMAVGGWRLRRVRLGTIVDLTPWATFGVAVVFLGNAVLSMLIAVKTPYTASIAGLALPAIPFQVLAACSAVWASWLIQRALPRVRPADIQSRLVDAIDFLEYWEREQRDQVHRDAGRWK
jgi:hypothetical protein